MSPDKDIRCDPIFRLDAPVGCRLSGLLRQRRTGSRRMELQGGTGLSSAATNRKGRNAMIDRRSLIKHSGAAIAALGAGLTFPSLRAFAATTALPFDNGERPLVKYPQKRPMIGLTSRPPQLETPFSVFNANVITPNDAFFVRYHLADVPLNIDPDAFSVGIQGKVDKPMKLSLADIKKMPAADIVAVNQCSGNSRGFFNPRVAGGQLGNGAMGNARWRGVPLKAGLAKACVPPGARPVSVNGMDRALAGHKPRFGQ